MSDLILKRQSYNRWGIISTLSTVQGQQIAFCLEHAYLQPGGSWLPKIPLGTWECIKGAHQLSGGPPFTTFEITGVAGHTGLLFHPGNYDLDSEGCVLLGTELGNQMILNSRIAFQGFITLQAGLSSFSLTVC